MLSHDKADWGVILHSISPVDWKNAIVYAGFVLSWPAYPWLKEVSDGAALVVPPLTVLFLIVRIYLAVRNRGK